MGKKSKECPQCAQAYSGKTCGVCGYAEPEKEKKQPKPREERTEAQIVAAYAKKIMEKAKSRNMMPKTHTDMVEFTPSKDIWQDKDFYFSVVFQSSAQKAKFLAFLGEKFNLTTSSEFEGSPQIINGLSLAKSMGLELKPERSEDFPLANMDLKDIILDRDTK